MNPISPRACSRLTHWMTTSPTTSPVVFISQARAERGGFVERFCSMLPSDGRVLDAACGTGKYFGMLLESGRSLLGVDHTEASLDRARARFPDVPTEKHDLQELSYRDEFDGVMCVDAREFVPPGEGPAVLGGVHPALGPGGGR